MTDRATLAKRNRRTALTAFSIVAGMVGMAFAFVPLYTLICEVTGLGGTPKVAETVNVEVTEKPITVRFDANIDLSLPWTFKPQVTSVTLNMGEQFITSYTATNHADEPVTGISTFNVSPLKAAQYFTKIECFCFIEQTLAPGKTVDMPVTFYVDPALLEDELARDVKTITLSYTFYRTLDDVSGEKPEIVSQLDRTEHTTKPTALTGST